MSKKKVLFISAPIGSGHIRAAKAIGKALSTQGEDIEIKIANVFDFFNPFLGQAILKIYLKILDIFPQLYGSAYSWGNTSRLALIGRGLISSYLAKRMHSYLLSYNPAVIICTHATPAGLIAYLARKGKLQVPIFAVITDFVVHRLWVYQEFTHYFVAHEAMRNYLNNYGIEHAKSRVCGIPVDSKFTMWIDKEKTLKKFNLCGNIKTILVMGGGLGVLPMEEIVKICDNLDIPVQILVVTGNNKAVYLKLLKLKASLCSSLTVFGYVDNVHELMAVSDLIVSKPGGMTSAEALCMGLPMVIYRPIPGQEEANTNYLVTKQVAVRADSISQMTTILSKLLLEDTKCLSLLRQNAKALGQPNAASRIADFIINKMHT